MDPQERRTRRRKGEGHVTRDAILAAARSLFLTEGYTRTTVRRIVERAGVTPPALYRHFADKDTIVRAIADDAFAKLEAAFGAARALPLPPIDRFRRMLEAFLRFGLEHPDEYRFVFMTPEVVPAAASHRNPAADAGGSGAACFLAFEAHVRELIEAGLLVPMPAPVAAELIWAAGHGLVALLITKPHFPWADRETLIRGMVDLPLRGLLPR
ncbi:MAG: TetR/AcrR family transcriptional regulator [Geminicoccaceae bacterium]